ncbi:hypothetical protein ACH347_11085 [Saccharopolyspora sp. 5N102]|uniref:hypothetical protein n=1 Tax=Saccharopolyspora sp. 5N102 TaxID=3375155 RepID=UPI0037B4BFC0
MAAGAPEAQFSRGNTITELNVRKPLVIASWNARVDPHVELARKLRPDLVVYDPMFAAGPVTAAVTGVPAVAHAIGIARFDLATLAAPPACEVFERHGLAVPTGIPALHTAPRKPERAQHQALLRERQAPAARTTARCR